MALSLAERCARLPEPERRAWLAAQPDDIIDEILRGEWWWLARPEQIPPEGDWLACLALAGRGFGKSRSGSEWLVERVLKHPYDRHGVPTEHLVVADTLADARTINAEGPSGILNVLTRRKVDHRYKQSPRPMVLFPDGAKIYEGADDPDTGRGYNAASIVCDEIAKWVKPYETWYEGLLPSLRADLMGDHPRAFITTTPKPINLLIEWLARDDGTIHVITGVHVRQRLQSVSPCVEGTGSALQGTALGEQELYGKLLELTGGGLFRRMDIVKNRVTEVPTPPRQLSWGWTRTSLVRQLRPGSWWPPEQPTITSTSWPTCRWRSRGARPAWLPGEPCTNTRPTTWCTRRTWEAVPQGGPHRRLHGVLRPGDVPSGDLTTDEGSARPPWEEDPG